MIILPTNVPRAVSNHHQPLTQTASRNQCVKSNFFRACSRVKAEEQQLYKPTRHLPPNCPPVLEITDQKESQNLTQVYVH